MLTNNRRITLLAPVTLAIAALACHGSGGGGDHNGPSHCGPNANDAWGTEVTKVALSPAFQHCPFPILPGYGDFLREWLG
jgi:hypothetical protein